MPEEHHSTIAQGRGAQPHRVLHKTIGVGDRTPNMPDYEAFRAAFAWDLVRADLDGLPDGRGVNIAHEAVSRHLAHARGENIALRWPAIDGTHRELTYRDLERETNRFANLLVDLDVQSGETVFTLLGRVPELYITALGTLKHRGIFSPLFSAFGPEPIRQRLGRGDGRVLVTTRRLYRKVEGLRDELPGLKTVLLIDEEADSPEARSFRRSMEGSADTYVIPPTAPEDPALLHFTSGTTGMPKGAVHVHEAILTHMMTGRCVLDLHDDDVFWCTADPGWVTGTSYGVIAPLALGVTSIVDEADFDADRWYRILSEQQVTVWYTSPTAIRRLMRIDWDPRTRYDLSKLRLIHSVGEPLNPEAVLWGERVLGLPIHDNWWQTETGGIMIANYPAVDIQPGSMGMPLPGIEAAIVHRTNDGGVAVEHEPMVTGELALRPGWPSMFRGYLHDEERYRKCFVGGWYLSGDLACRGADGYFWFVGRADDIIKTSGHMVGPFEVESALMEHAAVAEAGVIGKPDPLIGELVKAFVLLRAGFAPSEELRLELIGFARSRLGAAVAPKEIEFVESLPRTRSGKIMRRLLKAREIGLPEGDVSTLEESS